MRITYFGYIILVIIACYETTFSNDEMRKKTIFQQPHEIPQCCPHYQHQPQEWSPCCAHSFATKRSFYHLQHWPQPNLGRKSFITDKACSYFLSWQRLKKSIVKESILKKCSNHVKHQRLLQLLSLCCSQWQQNQVLMKTNRRKHKNGQYRFINKIAIRKKNDRIHYMRTT